MRHIIIYIAIFLSLVSSASGFYESETVSPGIEISRDSVKYDVSQFISSQTTNLKELFESLPGFEITEDREFFVFGQPVTSFKIDGVSLLFEKMDMVVATFPVEKVERVVVFDDTSDSEDDSGIADMDAPDKVVNVILKESCSDNLFGGMEVAVGDGSDRFLYNGKVAAALHKPGRQLSLYATAADNLHIENETEEGVEGILREYNAGIHYFTENIKKLEFKLGATYNSAYTEEDKVASRQSFFDSSKLSSERSDYCTLNKHRVGVSAQLSSAFGGKFSFEITPKLYYTNIESQSLFNTETFDHSNLLNRSKSQGFLKSNEIYHTTEFYFTYKDFGKPRRALIFDFKYHLSNEDSDNKEFSQVDYTNGQASDLTDILYDNTFKEYGYSGDLIYAEPLSERWSLNVDFASELLYSEEEDDAYTPVGKEIGFKPTFGDRHLYSKYDGTYSSFSESRYFANSGRILAQYKKNETLLQFGGYGQVLNNELLTISDGVAGMTGEGDYIWDWSPFVKFSTIGKKGRHMMVNYIGLSSALPNSLLLARPDIGDPSHITFGNIYLNPGFENNLNFYYNFNSKKKFNLMYLNFNISRKRRAVVDATWFDKEGVQYSVPVNAEKVTRNFSLEYNFSNIPIDRAHNLILNLSLAGMRSQYYGYQAIGESNVVDLQNFDYSRFMSKFWGSRADGADFYSGKTGFKESKTINTSISWDLNFEYTLSNFTFTLGASASRDILKYSFDEKANMNTWVVDPYFILEFETSGGLMFSTDLDYEMYDGYSEAYGEPGLMWNFYAAKKFRNFTLKASFDDILNDASYLHRTVTDNYVEESIARHLGRRIMLGVAFDF